MKLFIVIYKNACIVGDTRRISFRIRVRRTRRFGSVDPTATPHGREIGHRVCRGKDGREDRGKFQVSRRGIRFWLLGLTLSAFKITRYLFSCEQGAMVSWILPERR